MGKVGGVWGRWGRRMGRCETCTGKAGKVHGKGGEGSERPHLVPEEVPRSTRDTGFARSESGVRSGGVAVIAEREPALSGLRPHVCHVCMLPSRRRYPAPRWGGEVRGASRNFGPPIALRAVPGAKGVASFRYSEHCFVRWHGSCCMHCAAKISLSSDHCFS